MKKNNSNTDQKTVRFQLGSMVIMNIGIPLLMIVVVILVLNIGISYVFYDFNSKDVIDVATRLSHSEIKSEEQIKTDYSGYIVVYYDINKIRITEEGYGTTSQKGISHNLPDEYYKLVETQLNGVKYLVATAVMEAPYNGVAKYVRVYIDYSSEDNLKKQMLWICSLLITIVFVLQSTVGFFAIKMQMKPLLKTLEKNSRLISDVSHEFNTPLAIINSNISSALASPDSKVEDISESLAKAKNEAQRLKRMIKELLILSASDAKKVILNKENINLSELANEIAEPFMLMCELDEKEFVSKIDENIYLYTDKDKFRQIMIALLDNAVKYTQQGDKVGLTLCEREEKIVVSVWDTGHGVPEDEMVKIFDRFYRSDESRNSKTGGTGLGLAIVKEVAYNLGAKIYAKNNNPTGFVVEVEFSAKTNKTNK